MVETVFTIMLAPVVAFRVTLFMIGLAFGKSATWSGQARDAYRLTWRTAARGLWMQTAFGVGMVTMIATSAPSALPWATPVVTGLCLAIPFAVLTSHPALGRWTSRIGLATIPEERRAPAIIAAIDEKAPGAAPLAA